MILALPIMAYVAKWQQQIGTNRRTEQGMYLFGTALIVAALAVTLVFTGQPKRDAELLRDLEAIANHVGTGETLYLSPKFDSQWTLKAYLVRYYQIQLGDFSESEKRANQWVLAPSNHSLEIDKEEEIDLFLFRLYRLE